MPKHDPMSAKAISNRQKLVGLQKLKWYCQMCQKQCRDENGFKCHTMSESHLRQMRVFADNPHSVLDEFSREFERGFLETLNSLHGTKRVKANTVYQEYIQDKHHIHMNATTWTSLTGFCMYLGRESKAIVDETEKGWFIQYIDRDPKVLARQAQAEQRQQYELDEEERRKREIAAQVQAAEERLRASGQEPSDSPVDNSLVRDDANQKIAVALAPAAVTSTLGSKKRPRQVAGFGGDSDDEEGAQQEPKAGTGAEPVGGNLSGFPGLPPSRAGGVLPFATTTKPIAPSIAAMSSSSAPRNDGTDRLDGQSSSTTSRAGSAAVSEKHSSSSRPSSWLYKNLIVKILNKEIAKGRWYKAKGRVVRLLGRDYEEAEVEVDGEVHVLHCKDLDTVIPKVGQAVMIVRGKAAGCEGELRAIHEADYCCDVRVTQRSSDFYGQEMRGLEYEHVCKLAV